MILSLGCATVLGYRGVHAHEMHAAMMRADPETILSDPGLAKPALSLGRSVYLRHCSSCHGTRGQPDPVAGVPDIADGDFLYGNGSASEIELIVLHGIRAGDDKGWNLARMPTYAHQHPYAAEPIPPLRPGEIDDVVQYLIAVRGPAADEGAALRGAAIFTGKGGCFDCHGPDGGGDPAVGAPNLRDGITLYGDGSPAALYRSIAGGRAGISPAFARYLTPLEARAVAVYVASLPQSHRKTTN